MPDFFNSLLSKAIKGRRESRSPRHTPTRERMTNLGYALYAFLYFTFGKEEENCLECLRFQRNITVLLTGISFHLSL